MELKKGVFFTVSSMLFLLLFHFFVSISLTESAEVYRGLHLSQLQTVGSVINNFEGNQVPDLFRLAFVESVQSLNDYIEARNVSIAPEDLNNTLFNLTVYGTSPELPGLVVDENLDATLTTLSNLMAESQGSILTYSIDRDHFGVTQTEFWAIDGHIAIQYNISTPFANWTNRQLYQTISQPIIGFKDPLTHQRNHNEYVPNIYQTNVTEGSWNISLLREHIEAQTFDEETSAPSYLNRLVNLTDPSIYGISYFVRLDYLANITPQGVRHFADADFWESWNCSSGLDNLYNITSISNQPNTINFSLSRSMLWKYLNTSHPDLPPLPPEISQNSTRICS